MGKERDIDAARDWCVQARVILRSGANPQAALDALRGRVETLQCELQALAGAVGSGRHGIDEAGLTDYAMQLSTVAEGLRVAAASGDAAAVERQFRRLGELRQELAMRLALARGRGQALRGGPGQSVESGGQLQAYATARDAALLELAQLGLHAEQAAIASDIQAIESGLLAPAAALAEARDYAAALALVEQAPPACRRAGELADQCASWRKTAADVRVWLAQCRRQAQADAALAELAQADGLVAEAAARAGSAARDYAGALEALSQARALGLQADKIARRCVVFAAARPAAVSALQALARHEEADAVRPEIEALQQLLAEADEQASATSREYEKACLHLERIGTDAAAASALAEQGGQARRARIPALAALLALLECLPDAGLSQALPGLDATRAEAERLAGPGERRYAAATAMFARLLGDASAAREAVFLRQWNDGLAAAAADMRQALRAGSEERTRIGALWALAGESAGRGEHENALRLVASMRRLVLQAPPAPLATGLPVAERKDALDADARLSAALREAKELLDTALPAARARAAAFGGHAPPAWKTSTEGIAASLAALDRSSGLTAVLAAVAEARRELQSQEADIRALDRERSDWLARLAVCKGKAGSLAAYRSLPAPLQARLQALEREVDACQGRAAALDFAGARSALEDRITELDALLFQADAAGQIHYSLQQRRIELSAVPLSQPRAEALAARRAAQGCIDQAAADYGRGRYSDARDALAPVTGHIARVELVNAAAEQYAKFITDSAARIATLEGLADIHKRHMVPALDLLHTILGTAAAAAATDIASAAGAIGSAWRQIVVVELLSNDVRLAVDTRQVFDAALQRLEAHAGREAVEPMIQRARLDSDFAAACFARGEFGSAGAALYSYPPAFVTQVALADQHVIYMARREAAQDALDALPRDDPGGRTTSEQQSAQRHLAQAAFYQAQATGQWLPAKYDPALREIDSAALRLKDARALLGKALALRAMASPAGTDEASTRARIAAFAAMKTYVRAQAGDGGFDALLDSAEVLVAQAGVEPLDVAAANAALDRAEAMLADALDRIGRQPGVLLLLAATALDAETILPGINTGADRCLDEELRQMTEVLARARPLAAPPALDFVAAGQLLAEARMLGDKAREKSEVFIALRDDRKAIRDLVADLLVSPYQLPLERERRRLEQFDADIGQALDAFDFAQARRLAARAMELVGGSYARLCPEYDQATQTRVDCYAQADLYIAGQPGCADEDARQAAMRTQIDRMIDDEHAFTAASPLLGQLYALAMDCDQIGQRHAYFTAQRTLQADRLDAARARAEPDLAEPIRQAEALLAAVDALAGSRQFLQANGQLPGLARLLDAIEHLLPLAALYATARDAARAAMEALGRPGGPEALASLRAFVQAGFDRAVATARRGDFAAAQAAMQALARSCDEARAAAGVHTPPAAATDIDAALASLLTREQALRAEPPAGQLAPRLLEALECRTRAERLRHSDPAGAQRAIGQAGVALAAAQAHRMQLALLRREAAQALLQLDDFSAGAHPAKACVAAPLAAIRAAMEQAPTLAALDRALEEFHQLLLLADRRQAYVELRSRLEPPGAPSALQQLETQARRHAAGAEIETLRASLLEAAAAAEAEPPQFDRAMAALRTAVQAESAARLATALLGSPGVATPAIQTGLAEVMASPGGAAKVDRIVASLDPNTQREVVCAAFLARFGCVLGFFRNGTLDTSAVPGPDALRLYRTMAALPEAHTLGNDSMLFLNDLQVTGGPRPGSAYDSRWQLLIVSEGRHEASLGRVVGAPGQLGDAVAAECQPADARPVPLVDWNTLHEAGHAVDDKYGFMNRHMGEPAYGGWTDYGGDLLAVARKLEAEFAFDRRYIVDLLAGVPDPALPPLPAGVANGEWEQRRMRLSVWVDRARPGNEPWESHASSLALALASGEIIQESYPGRWCGYLASERARGLTGYQFRAPGEWFSELYAGFHAGKLKPTHPAAAWLTALDNA